MTLFGQEQEVSTPDDYLTPGWVFDALGVEFDLDVAASPFGGHVPARDGFTMLQDGLSQQWAGRVWMNPPYSEVFRWMPRFLEHANGIALVPQAKSAWHSDLWQRGDCLFVIPRAYFLFDGGSIPYPVFFVGMGEWARQPLAQLGKVWG